MGEMMKIVVVEPYKRPCIMEIEHTLENLQKIVGGCIQAIYPWDEAVSLVCNDNGIAEGLALNRNIHEYGYGPVVGTFFLCGLTEDDFGSLTDEQAEFFLRRFEMPELIGILDGEILAIPMTEDEIAEMRKDLE